jgi:hypothetical protein
MRVRVFPRVFDGTHFISGIDAHLFKQFDLPLRPWATTSDTAKRPVSTAAKADEATSNGGLSMRPGRRLTYRFLNLPYHARIKIVHQLDLVHPDDEGLRDSELYARYFARAAEKGDLPKLWDLIDEQSESHEDNPFSKIEGAA